MDCQIEIDGTPFSFQVSGDVHRGEEEVLYNEKTSPIANMPWKDQGFSVIDLFSDEEIKSLRHNSTDLLGDILKETGCAIDSDFKLEDYHKYVTSKESHQRVIEQTRELRFKDFCLDEEKIAKTLSKVLRTPIQARNEDLDREIIQLRISRPNSYDVNPPHRDSYLKIYEKVLNMWIPLVGCNEKSCLPVIPGSHYWEEKSLVMTEPGQAMIAGQRYRVPAIVESNYGMKFNRVVPRYGQAIVFTPFLIHGASFNKNPDETRMAYELRLYHKC